MARNDYHTISSEEYLSPEFVSEFAEKCNLDGPLSYEYDPKIGTKFVLKETSEVPPDLNIQEVFGEMKPEEVNMDFVSFSVY